MTSIDYFYLSLGTGFVILVGCAVLITVEIYRILQDVRGVSEKVMGVATDVSALKDGVKLAVLTLIQGLLEKAKRGGVQKHGKSEE